MASSAASVSSFELVEEQQLTEEDVAMASEEAQEERTCEAAVTAGLVLEEPLVAPTRTAAEVAQDRPNAREMKGGSVTPNGTPSPRLGEIGSPGLQCRSPGYSGCPARKVGLALHGTGRPRARISRMLSSKSSEKGCAPSPTAARLACCLAPTTRAHTMPYAASMSTT